MANRAPQQVVAIIGGATAGAEAAGMFADRGALAVVFEQNARPYGKIEDRLRGEWRIRLLRNCTPAHPGWGVHVFAQRHHQSA